jgi:hypothetical protein
MPTMLKRSLVVFSLAALLVTGFAFGGARPAKAASCVGFDVLLRNDLATSATATISFILPYPPHTQLTPTYRLTLAPGEIGYLHLVAYLSVPPPYILGGGPGGLTILGIDNFGNNITPNNCTGGGIFDGRLNHFPIDIAAPVAVYCSPEDDGGIDAYAIDPSTSEGTLAFRTTGDEDSAALDEAAANGSSVQIASGSGITLWATADGGLAVTGLDLNGEGKTYHFDFAGDACG